ncbi:hypothetical protein VTP01DRAFT_2350 [Rhizomucor pusillus]|uniref:uncharacterized protein n=1 Tax=Rhizomucor pusillus TaxID=4840 RepID=UPI003744A593
MRMKLNKLFAPIDVVSVISATSTSTTERLSLVSRWTDAKIEVTLYYAQRIPIPSASSTNGSPCIIPSSRIGCPAAHGYIPCFPENLKINAALSVEILIFKSTSSGNVRASNFGHWCAEPLGCINQIPVHHAGDG